MTAGVILYVENCREDVELAGRMFERLQVLNPLKVVRDGQEALDYLLGEDQYAARDKYPFPSLVLLDIGLPKVDGFEVLGFIRNHAALKHLPVVILSTSDAGQDKARAFELGATSFMTKTNSQERFRMWLLDLSHRILAAKHPEALIQFKGQN